MSDIIIPTSHSGTMAQALASAFVKQENDFVERILKQSEDWCPLKTYRIVRAKNFEELKAQVDAICSENPDLEMADMVNMPQMGYDKYVAVLVHYDFEEKERRQAVK